MKKVKIDLSAKKIIVSESFKKKADSDFTSDEFKELKEALTICPDFDIVVVKKEKTIKADKAESTAKRNGLNRSAIVDYINANGTEEQKEEYQGMFDDKVNFLKIKAKFIKDFPQYLK